MKQSVDNLILSTADSDCLLIIDVQNDFCTAGALEVPAGDDVVNLINTLSERFSTVVATQDWHPADHSSFASQHSGKDPFSVVEMPYGEQTLWPEHCIQGSSGAEFHPELNTAVFQNIIRKGFRRSIDSYSAFYENDRTTSTGLGGYLKQRGVKRVYSVGLAFDFCVRYTAEDAVREGFESYIIEPACRGIDLAGSMQAAYTALELAGVKVLQR